MRFLNSIMIAAAVFLAAGCNQLNTLDKLGDLQRKNKELEEKIDSLLQAGPDTIYLDSIIIPPCFLCFTDSFYMYEHPENNLIKFYVAGDDTFIVQQRERTFYRTNYSFTDTVIQRTRITWADSTIVIDSLIGNIIYSHVLCEEYAKDCKQLIYAVPYGKPRPSPTTTWFLLRGYSTICESNYATINVSVNGRTDLLSAGGQINLEEYDEHFLWIDLPMDSIKIVEIDWRVDCWRPDIGEDRNVYIKNIELNGKSYMDSTLVSFEGRIKWSNNQIVMASKGTITIKP